MRYYYLVIKLFPFLTTIPRASMDLICHEHVEKCTSNNEGTSQFSYVI